MERRQGSVAVVTHTSLANDQTLLRDTFTPFNGVWL